MKNTIKTLVILLLFVSTNFAQTEWAFDKSHSNVSFSVTHMVIAETEGTFRSYEGKVVSKDDSFENAEISLSVDIKSIDTDNEKRDTHLKSDDFFNAEKYPAMTFKSKDTIDPTPFPEEFLRLYEIDPYGDIVFRPPFILASDHREFSAEKFNRIAYIYTDAFPEFVAHDNVSGRNRIENRCFRITVSVRNFTTCTYEDNCAVTHFRPSNFLFETR